MDYDQKQFLELLYRFKSDETKKARRNVSTISFTVLAVWVLGIGVKDVRVLGVSLSDSSEKTILILGAALLLYWLAMFLLSWLQDQKIQSEREHQLDIQVKDLIKRFEKMDADKKEKESKGQRLIATNYAKYKASYELYHKQSNRTKAAVFLSDLIENIEIYVPVVLSVIAFIVLGLGFYHA